MGLTLTTIDFSWLPSGAIVSSWCEMVKTRQSPLNGVVIRALYSPMTFTSTRLVRRPSNSL
jgi:hypothetical protein